MKILLLQTDIKWKSPAYNRKRAEELINSSEKSDLIILPEMFNSGFCLIPEEATEENGESLLWMQKMAKEKDAALVGSISVEENGKYYNRLYFVKPDGSYKIYNKRHLFSYAGEDKEYQAGGERVVVDYKGYSILVQICYDLRFPVFTRNLGDYDMIIYVANWPASRANAWETLIRARAIENLCYVAAVNRTGEDPACKYIGGSALIDYKGHTLVDAEDDAEKTIHGEIDIEALKKFRQKFPALKDADKFKIII